MSAKALPVRALAWRRRARPLLGTLVEIGAGGPVADRAIDAGFEAIAAGASHVSRFEATSDVARFAALPAGDRIVVHDVTAEALRAAAALRDASGAAFDITLGRAPHGWRLDGCVLHKLDRDASLDLGGIAKGLLVDAAVDALQGAGCTDGWVNAGGDLRAFGRAELPIRLRDEAAGGTRFFATLAEGAFATSAYGSGSRSQAWPACTDHISVAAPRCLWADALTKIVAASGNAQHPLLARFGAQAWRHAP